MSFLEYHKEEKLEFNHKKSCGLWLIVVGLVIALATLIGGKQIINMQVFSFGYIISFLSINMNKKLINKLSTGNSTAIHFFPFYFVHGKSMILLGIVCSINIAIGYIYSDMSLSIIAYIDALIKLLFGLYLFFLSKPTKR